MIEDVYAGLRLRHADAWLQAPDYVQELILRVLKIDVALVREEGLEREREPHVRRLAHAGSKETARRDSGDCTDQVSNPESSPDKRGIAMEAALPVAIA